MPNYRPSQENNTNLRALIWYCFYRKKKNHEKNVLDKKFLRIHEYRENLHAPQASCQGRHTQVRITVLGKSRCLIELGQCVTKHRTWYYLLKEKVRFSLPCMKCFRTSHSSISKAGQKPELFKELFKGRHSCSMLGHKKSILGDQHYLHQQVASTF